MLLGIVKTKAPLSTSFPCPRHSTVHAFLLSPPWQGPRHFNGLSIPLFMPSVFFLRDHLRSAEGIICGSGIICGRGSFVTLSALSYVLMITYSRFFIVMLSFGFIQIDVLSFLHPTFLAVLTTNTVTS